MATLKITLTATPVQISNGLKKVYAQSLNGDVFRFVQSTAAPTNNTVYHTANELSISEGFSIWAWNPGTTPFTLVTSTAE